MRNSLLVLLTTAVLAFGAYDLPSIRNIGALQVLLKPDRVGSRVEFTFEKQDMNGYVGGDSIVFTLLSPSGKTAWEGAVPDDGDDGQKWIAGPRQPVTVSFVAEEPGIYSLTGNTASPDLHLWFDRAQVRNAAWGLSSSRMRFSSGGKLDAFLLLEPRRLGELRDQIMQLCIFRHTRISGVTVTTSDGQTVVPKVTPPPSQQQTYHQILLKRTSPDGIYRMQAERFTDVISLIFPKYGEYMLFTEERFARAFRQQGRLTGNILSLETPAGPECLAFGKAAGYQATFIPKTPEASYDFTADVFGKKVRFTNRASSCFVETPAENDYAGMEMSDAPAGRIELVLAESCPTPISPLNGTCLKSGDTLLWSVVKGSPAYTLTFLHVDSGFSFREKTSDSRLSASALKERLTPGVWRWSVSADGAARGPEGFFIVPKPGHAQLPYFYDFTPRRDSALEKAPQELACRVDLLNTNEIDYARSFVLVNETRYRLTRLSSTRIECPEKPAYVPGFNAIRLVVYDRNGLRSETSWGFYLGKAPDRPQVTHDGEGRIFFNGLPFFPVIYYGYKVKNLMVEFCGFNTVLGNTLPSRPFLEQLRSRNLKLLDSGSVYYGIYSKPKTAAGAEEDVRQAAVNGSLRHQARLGAWMDEMDVHRSTEYIRVYLSLFGAPENGWRGVCSCNSSLGAEMASLGDFLMIDHYGFGERIFSTDAATARGRADAAGKPLFSLLKGFSNSDPKLTGFIPVPRDVEYAAFATLRLKANAIGLYQCGEYRMEAYPESWKWATLVYRRLNALTFAAYGKDVPAKASVSGNHVAARTMQVGDTLYILVQNTSFIPEIVHLNINGAASTEVFALFEDRSIALANGSCTDALEAAGTRIYAVRLN